MTTPEMPVVEEGTFDPDEESADQTQGLTRDSDPEVEQTEHPAGEGRAARNSEDEPTG